MQTGIDALGLSLVVHQQELLVRYLALLAQWNAVYNLTSVRDPLDMLALHVLDSLAIVHLVRDCEGSEVLDVGSGAGLPGVPLAIALPQHRFQLVDAVGKKVSFLQQVKASLRLENVQAHHVRIEALTLAKIPSIIVSRAYAELSRMLGSIAHLANRSTTVIAMKGIVPAEELAALPASWRVLEVRTLHVPLVGAHRCAVVLRRD
ncbi:MAG: 16S rRNA (guanine(527)-N(7))-methyltransferase RsmG [Burkholderiaceae bacterium]